ncbi:hypothetical protein NIES4071_71570 [Calothrix sp. NIES-4071]|nr:hypothetical protein NIES4071_71570 [Calothrix sp. NIES-4071]BAZ61432.1 hypothetical protein NIES4105_71520 [Calothrix sp. NIES-4105]
MATIERIEQDIKALEQTASRIANSLQDSYTAYFDALGKAVRQQLILATYHLCTQGYPQIFLRLSLNQRQKLQQSIRNLGTQTADHLAKYTKPGAELVPNQGDALILHNTAQEKPVDGEEPSEKETDGKETAEKEDKLEISQEAIPLSFIQLLASEASPFDMEDVENMEDMEDMDDDIEDMDDDDMEELELEDMEEFEDEDTVSNSEEELKPQPEKKPDSKKAIPRLPKIPIFPLINPVPLRFSDINASNPMEINRWVQSLEISTQFALKKLSRETNLLLQKSEILPKKLPEPVIEAAATVSEAADVMPGPPNVLNVVVEIESEQKKGEGLTQIMAVNLRLTEIEFADSQVSVARKQLRILHGQLQKLRRDYFKKQRELAVAQAEAAWRASWFDDL